MFRNHTATIAQLEAEKAEIASSLSRRIAELFAENQQLRTDFEQFRKKVQTDRQTAEDIVARTNARAEAYLVQTRQKVAEIEQKADEHATQIRNDALQEAERVRENSRVAIENTRADISKEWTKLSERQAQMDQLIQSVKVDAERIRAEAHDILVDAAEQKHLAEKMVQTAEQTADQLEQETEIRQAIVETELEPLIVQTLEHCSTIFLQQAIDELDEAEKIRQKAYQKAKQMKQETEVRNAAELELESLIVETLEHCSAILSQQTFDEADYARRDAYCQAGHILDDATDEAEEIIQNAQEDAENIIAGAKTKAMKMANCMIARAEEKEDIIKDRAFRYLLKFINDRNFWSDDLVYDRNRWSNEDCLRLNFSQQDEIWEDPGAYGDDD